MRNIMNRMIAVLTALCMVAPVSVWGTGNSFFDFETDNHIQEDTTDPDFQSFGKINADGQLPYAEGQAIVMYSDKAAGIRIAKNGDIGDGMKIVPDKTYHFNGSITGERTIKSLNGKNRSFMVSLVESKSETTEQMIQKLSKKAGVLYAEPNYRIHLTDADPYERFQWALENTGQNAGTPGLDINADIKTPNAEGEKVIALIDSGIDYTHEDLQDVLWNNPYAPEQLEGKYGCNCIDKTEMPWDDNGHGTHCAGIMKAQASNALGIRGVDSSENIKIMALKFVDKDGFGDYEDAIAAYNYIHRAQRLGTNIVAINNSWGGISNEQGVILKELINLVGEEGALSIYSAGNDSTDNDRYEAIPANIDSDYIVSVAASNENDELAGFSSYGKKSVDIAAPGTDILSTVSSATFNPVLYGKNSKLVSMYEEFDSLERISPQIRNEGIWGSSSSDNVSVTVSDKDGGWFGTEKKGSSLKWSIHNAKEGEAYYLDIPYQVPDSTTDIYTAFSMKAHGPIGQAEELGGKFRARRSELYVCNNMIKDGKVREFESRRVKGIYITERGNYWNNVSYDTTVRDNSTRAVTLVVNVKNAGDYEVYVDDFAVSAKDVSVKSFGKYEFMNGTSMAAPHVTAAVAILANECPTEDVLARKKRLLGCVRQADDLEDKVATGGVLDLSKADMEVSKMSYDKASGKLKVTGHFLSDASVSVNGKDVLSSYDDIGRTLSFDVSSYHNQTVSVKLSKNGKNLTKEYFIATGNPYDREETYCELSSLGGELVSTGDALYYVEDNGLVSKARYESSEDQHRNTTNSLILGMDGSDGYSLAMFGETYKTVVNYQIFGESFIVPANRKLYQLVALDLGYSKERFLASYIENEGWKAIVKLPEQLDNLDGITLAMYDGIPYLLGGFDPEREMHSDRMYQYDQSSDEWIECGKMPEGRSYAKAIQTGEELVVTLGANASGTVPRNLILTNGNWEVSQSNFGEVLQKDTVSYKTGDEEKQFSVVRAQTGVVKNGIIYAGICAENMGDTFMYSVPDDTYTDSSYALNNTDTGNRDCYATTWGDRFYVLCSDGMDNQDLSESKVQMYTIPVEDGMMYVNDYNYARGPMDAWIEGVGGYLPGDMIVVTAKISEAVQQYAHISGMTIDDLLIDADDEGICTYEIPFSPGKSVNVVTKITLNQKEEDTINELQESTTAESKKTIIELGESITKRKEMETASKEVMTFSKRIDAIKIQKILKKKRSAKKVVVIVDKKKNVSGYQFRLYTTKKNAIIGKKAFLTKIVLHNGTKFTITNTKLKNKKTLFIRVRAVVKSQGNWIYGVWSAVKKIKMKKQVPKR